MAEVPGNNHWYDRNCDPSDAPVEEDVVQSGGGPTNVRSDGQPADKTVNQVLEDLIGQCYGDTKPAPGKNFIPPEVADLDNSFSIGWGQIYDFLRNINVTPPDTSAIYVNFPNPDDPNSGDACTDSGADGVINCDKPKNPDFEECIKNHLDCMFKPYVGGGWKPPKADCDSFVPKRMFGVSQKICVQNCVTKRIPIYEHQLGGGDAIEANATFSSTSTLSLSSAGIVTLEFWWDDNPSTAGTAVDSISVGGVTFTRSGEKGRIIKTVTLSAGSHSISYSGLNSAVVTNKYGTNKNIKYMDGDGTDENARLTIVSSSNDKNHLYSISASPPPGYTSNGIKFYANQTGEGANSIPVYVSYSAQNTDTMLTIDPEGEKSTMDSYGMGARDEVLFYAYPDSDSMYSELIENEQPLALHRYWSDASGDHYYTIDPIGGILEPDLKNNRYILRDKAETYVNIDYECRKGSAGYENTLGWYVTDGVDGNPIYGEVMLPNATDASGKYITKIPKSKINQYIPCSLGFFLVPDGNDQNGNVNVGDSVSFTAQGDGYRTNLSSAEGNYTFLSQRKFNPNNKDFTNWPNRSWMYWEDLLNGDDDFDDTKVSYRIRYGESEYIYEGIQCYVFGQDAVPVYEDLNKGDCGQSISSDAFTNVEISRSDCGNFSEDERGGAGSGCAKCTGGYTIQNNTVQSVTVYKDAELTLRSHGGMTGGRGECTKFRYKFYKNGTEILNQVVVAREWGRIGTELARFNVNEGDELTFEVAEIISGHYNARITPAFSLRNEDDNQTVNTWSVAITTTSSNYNTAVPGQTAGRTQEATEPCGLAVSGNLFAIDEDGNEASSTSVLSNKTVLSNVMRPQGEYVVRAIRNKEVRTMSAGQTGIVTAEADGGMVFKLSYTIVNPADSIIDWELLEVKNYGKGGYEVGDKIRMFIGSWTQIKATRPSRLANEDRRRNTKYYLGFKVTAINDLECPASNNDQGKIQDVEIDSPIYSYQCTPYLLPSQVINNRSVTGNEYKINMNTFFQSLFLYNAGQAESFDTYFRREQNAGRDVIFQQDYRDVRGFRYRVNIRVEKILSYDEGDAYQYPRYGWFGNISIGSVISWGKRYSENETLTLQYPPARLQSTNGQEVESPFYPSQENLPKDVLVRDRTTGRFKRNARYALYQESHNKNSNLWYSNQSVYKPSQYTDITLIIKDVD